MTNTENRENFKKALLLLCGCVKALDNLSTTVLKEVLLPLVACVWSWLCNILRVL